MCKISKNFFYENGFKNSTGGRNKKISNGKAIARIVSQTFILEGLNPLIALMVVLGHTKRV